MANSPSQPDPTPPDAHEAFLRVYTDCQRKIHAYIGTFLWNASDVDEVLQETSIILWRKFSQFDPRQDFFRWACGIAWLEVQRYLRSHDDRMLLLGDDVLNLIAAHQIDEADDLEQRRDALEDCLTKLRPRDRQLVERCYDPDFTTVDVAREIGRPVNAVYQSLGRIRRLLFECINRFLAERR